MAWPAYLKHSKEIEHIKEKEKIITLDGTKPLNSLLEIVLNDIERSCNINGRKCDSGRWWTILSERRSAQCNSIRASKQKTTGMRQGFKDSERPQSTNKRDWTRELWYNKRIQDQWWLDGSKAKNTESVESVLNNSNNLLLYFPKIIGTNVRYLAFSYGPKTKRENLKFNETPVGEKSLPRGGGQHSALTQYNYYLLCQRRHFDTVLFNHIYISLKKLVHQ